MRAQTTEIKKIVHILPWRVFAIWSIIDASNQSGSIKMEIESYLEICFPCCSNGIVKCNDSVEEKKTESKWKIRVPNDVRRQRERKREVCSLRCSVPSSTRAHAPFHSCTANEDGVSAVKNDGITLHQCDVPCALALSVKYIFASILDDLLYHLARFNVFAAHERSLLTLHNETDSDRTSAMVTRAPAFARTFRRWVDANELRLVFLWIKFGFFCFAQIGMVGAERKRHYQRHRHSRHSTRANDTC